MSGIAKSIGRALSSRRLTLGLLTAAAVAIAVATFLEAGLGPEAGRLFVYETIWFEAILLLLGLNLTANLRRWWPLKFEHAGFLLIHAAVIVILAGAGATRYFGYEGVLALRKGAESSRMVSRTNHLQITCGTETGSRRMHFLSGGPHEETMRIRVGTEPWNAEVVEYWPHYRRGATTDETAPAALRVRISAPETPPVDSAAPSATVILVVGSKREVSVAVGGRLVGLSCGPVPIALPYRIGLEDFVMTTYPGSENPAFFESFVRVFDLEGDGPGRPGRIFTNGPLLYRGFKHFQWSYDKDRQGTILIISRDPGRLPTYAGYGLITLGFCLLLVQRLVRRAPARREIS